MCSAPSRHGLRGAVRFFRFEDVTTRGCTAPLANPATAERYQRWAARADHSFESLRKQGYVLNESVWKFWNYTEAREAAEVSAGVRSRRRLV